MILLDTNVVSEPLRPAPAVRVIEWMDAQPMETLFLSAITPPCQYDLLHLPPRVQ